MRMTPRLNVSLLVAAAMLGAPAAALAQLDPLLFMKRAEPNVLVLVDTSDRMQRDADEDYYDPNIYTRTNALWEAAIGVNALTTTSQYRRKYVNLIHKNSSGEKFEADEIVTVGDANAAAFAAFEERTRISVARRAIADAVRQNFTGVRWGLLRMRQSNPQVAAAGSSVTRIDENDLQEVTSDGSSSGKWTLTRTRVVNASGVVTANGSLGTVTAPLVRPDAGGANQSVLDILAKDVRTAGALIPAGADDEGTVDAPLENLLEDAHVEALRLVVDLKCRNTAAVLVTGGGEGNTDAGANPVDRASKFLLNLLGRRVPIFVVAIAPATAAERTELQSVALESGGAYTEITEEMIERALDAGTSVPELVAAINFAVQKTFVDPTVFNTTTSATLPMGPSQEFQVTSPIVGTVNLENARAKDGTALPNTVVTHQVTGTKIPQRSNVMVTTGFEMPGFYGRLRAFRMYQPVIDASKPSGYKFSQVGTPLWVASAPAAAQRNIYTALPDGTLVSFDSANAATLQPYLRTANAAAAADLIAYVRAQPLGAVVGSTPALMDAPSLDPPPDASYPAFADENKNRRSIVWVGANDGMLHAIDGRLGKEVWAFIPFNLLPKLRAVRGGQPVSDFRYFMDGSPKVADVKVNGAWRTHLIVGQGSGGTFYQTFDVTLDNMALTAAPTSDVIEDVLTYFASPAAVKLKWTFPQYSHFDHTLGDYGDLAATAPQIEKTVGETWSDPAVGQVENESGRFVVLTGSGFFKWSLQQQANRGGTQAGTTFYVLDAETGELLDSRNVGDDGKGERVDSCASVLVNDCRQMKNALQADPVATGPADSRFITRSYIGDLDGRIWRFDIGNDEAGKPKVKQLVSLYTVSTGTGSASDHPIFASMAAVTVGAQQYLFLGTGSDLLPQNEVSTEYALLVVLDQGTTGSQTAIIKLEKTDGLLGDEKVSAFPAVAGDIVFFATSTYKGDEWCGPNVDGNLYAFTFIGGPAYDTNNDGKLSSGGKAGPADSTKVRTATGARASSPFIVDQHVGISMGDKIELFGDEDDFNNGVGQAGVRILSWREVR